MTISIESCRSIVGSCVLLQKLCGVSIYMGAVGHGVRAVCWLHVLGVGYVIRDCAIGGISQTKCME